MSQDILGLLQDLSRYANLGLERIVYPRLGRGVDYRAADWKHQAARAVARVHPPQLQLEVVEILDETPSTKTFRFKRTDGPLPPFRAGQYVNLYVELDGVRTSRPYSISSAPGGAHLDLTVRDNPGGFVAPHLLARLREGDRLVSSGPTGTFYYEPLCHGDDLVMLAGGSGITPMMSMIRDQQRQNWPQRVQLVYGSRTPDDVIFDAELQALAAQSPRFDFTSVISDPPQGYFGAAGLLDAERLRESLDGVDGKTFYLCGPIAMYDLCLSALAELGVARHRIRRELYGPPDDITAAPGWPSGVDRDATFDVELEDGKRFKARAGEPLLASLERHGVVVPALCRSGECSACRTRVLQGRVFEPPAAGVRESDREAGYVHACVTYPLSDLLIRL